VLSPSDSLYENQQVNITKDDKSDSDAAKKETSGGSG